jgi:hypothetical protein
MLMNRPVSAPGTRGLVKQAQKRYIPLVFSQ